MTDLAGWKEYDLREVGTFVGGATPSTSRAEFWHGDIHWTTTRRLGTRYVVGSGERFISKQGLQESSTTLVPAGNLLIGTRVGIGKVAVTGVDIAISQDLTGVIVDKERFDPMFLAMCLSQTKVQDELARRARGVTIQGVPRDDLTSLRVLIPGLSEQTQIAAVLSEVQSAIECEDQIVDRGPHLKRTAMRELFTRGLRGDEQKETEFGPVPAGWNVIELGEIGVVQTGAAKGRQFGGAETVEVPYLRVANVQDGHLNLTEMKTIRIRRSELDRYRLKNGDVVLTEGGDFDKLGRGFIWSGELDLCVHQNHVFAVRPAPDLLKPKFFAYQCQSTYGKAYFLKVAHKTTNLACINSTKLKAFPVLVPTEMDEQNEIVEILDAIDKKIDLHKRKKAVLDQLFKALLHKLMSGEIRVGDLDLSALDVSVTPEARA